MKQIFFDLSVFDKFNTFCFSSQGSGKSVLSRALCRKAREDLDAHVEVVDCKKLQGEDRFYTFIDSKTRSNEIISLFLSPGKRADRVRQTLRDVFEQAEWRQPSVVLLEDLDYLTHTATSPEHEHGPEALLHRHIAQSESRNVFMWNSFSRNVWELNQFVCFWLQVWWTWSTRRCFTPAWCVWSSPVRVNTHFTLHSPRCRALTSSRDLLTSSHQTRSAWTSTFNLIKTNKQLLSCFQPQRAEILHHLILKKSLQSEETLHTLDLGVVAKETEGYTAQDLALLVERAVHANITQTGQSNHGNKTNTKTLRFYNLMLSDRFDILCVSQVCVCQGGTLWRLWRDSRLRRCGGSTFTQPVNSGWRGWEGWGRCGSS